MKRERPAAAVPDPRAHELEAVRFVGGVAQPHPDFVAVEEPLEIRVEGESVAVVMRTPGHDRELAAGFLVTEGVVREPSDIFEISECPGTVGDEGQAVDVLLTDPGRFDLASLTRHVFTSSSCGVCGKATIEQVMQRFPPVDPPAPAVGPGLLATLPGKLRAAQETFDATGGLHACALFDRKGDLLLVREDVGRHNALDKLVGAAWSGRAIAMDQTVLFLSGRVSFEMMQKALAARIPAVAAISAPTSLAVSFALASGQFLAGFVRGDTCNVYTPHNPQDPAGHPGR